MHQVEIFLPLFDNSHQPFPAVTYDDLRNKLKDQFGGVTFHRHTPVEGLWKDDEGKTNYDELIIAEIMTSELDREWWKQFKLQLEHIFKQQEILVRVFEFLKI